MTSAARRLQNLGTAAGAVTAVLFALFDLYQWALAYAADRFHNDFSFYFAAARIGLAHGWGSIYNLALQQAELNAMGSGITIAELARYISPPPVAWLALPFTALPYPVAYWTWSGMLVVALILTWQLAAPGSGRVRLIHLAAAAGWLPVIYALQLGQPGILVALGIAGCCALVHRDQPLLAGVALGAIAFKPQLAFLVPPALLVARHDRAFVASVIALGVLAVASAAALGTSGINDYIARLNFATNVPVNRELTLASFIGENAVTRAVQVVIAVWTLFLVYRMRRRAIEWPFVCALVGGILATPYVHLDDLSMLGLAGWLCLRASPPRWTWIYVLGLVLIVEGEPIWGPAPVIVAEIGALVLLSTAALTFRDVQSLQQIDARPLEIRPTR